MGFLNENYIPTEISNCLHKALELERENRFDSAEEMQIALQKAVSHETRRKQAEERNKMLAEQAQMKREREEPGIQAGHPKKFDRTLWSSYEGL